MTTSIKRVFVEVCRLGGVLAWLLATSGTAVAHPHVWIDVRSEVLFEDGAVVGLRHHWKYDPYSSAWAIMGLDADSDGILTPSELQPWADENAAALDRDHYFTFLRDENGKLVTVAGASAPSVSLEADRITFTFTTMLDVPHRVADRLKFEVGDSEYYYDLFFAGQDAVTIEGAPDGCTKNVVGNSTTVTCPTVAVTAVEFAQSPPTQESEFTTPPLEARGSAAQSGLAGWITEQQRDFYLALTRALGTLQEGWTGFWVLGTISFLYGVFHAAGPGHGKLVISSYMLANERQLRRGVLLSFLAAMMQASVAVALVLIATLAVRLTSIAMNEIANWLTIGSYGVIVLLGTWLVGCKIASATRASALASVGHHHDHRHGEHHDEHGAHHAIMPKQADGDWRERLGVVLAIGLRPCSGALVVLGFAMTQGMLVAGIVSTFVMGLGTAITVAVLAVTAVAFKGAALRISGGSQVAGRVVWWMELGAALLVMASGLLLLLAAL